MKPTISQRYLLFGVLFGLCFPIGATLALCAQQGIIDSNNIIKNQSENILLWIIDSAPFFLGMLAWLAGKKQQKINEINEGLGQKIEEQTLGLSWANDALRHEIEERARREQDLIEAKEAAEAGIRSKDQFLSNMSHEIRTPMNGILGMTDILLNTMLTEKQRKYLSAIDYSAKNLLVIINDILDLSKINAEKLEFEKVNFKIMDVVQSVENTLKFKADEKGIVFRIIVDKKIPDKMTGDPVRFSQILLNIAGNAVKFTERGEVAVYCQLVKKTDDGYKIGIEVKDTGIGIPKGKLSSIFENFTQANNRISSKFGGTGLGLPISKKLIELQGGELSVISEEGIGSTFSFTLQFGFPTAELEESEPEIMEISEVAKSKIRILLAEDNQINQLVAQSFLNRYGFKTDVAENGKEAIQKVIDNDYSLILMDVQMPEMDGLEATRYIRTQLKSPKCDVKIMAMTASVLKKEIDKCFEAGMDAYIPKPFDPKVLYEKIVSLVCEQKVAS